MIFIKRYAFKFELYTIFIVCISIPLVIFIIIFIMYFNNLLLEENNKFFSSILYSESKNIQTLYDELVKISSNPILFNNNMTILTKTLDSKNADSKDIINKFDVEKNYSYVMGSTLLYSRKEILGILLLDNDESNTYSNLISRNKGSHTINNSMYFVEKDWYKKAIELNGIAILTPIHTVSYYNKNEDTEVFSLLRYIYNPTTKTKVGVIKVDVDAKAIKDIFSNIDIKRNSSLTILTEDKEVIYSSQRISNDILEKVYENQQVITTKDDVFYVIKKDIPNTPWFLCYLSSKKNIFNKTAIVYIFAIFLCIIFAIISYFLFKLKSRDVLKSINYLVKAMKEIENGDLSVRLDYESEKFNEFRTILMSFNVMTEKLKDYIDREFKSELLRKNAEYMALQTQINPHFLYNILNSFVTLNRLGERKILEASILRLTGMFRYNCNNYNDSSIKEELSFLEKYLELQKLRFEERLTYYIDKEISTENIFIPKLLLQPFVENSIVHGMESSDRIIFIEVYVFIQYINVLGKFLVITIRDNGVGFDSTQNKKNDSVGIKNVLERIDILYKISFVEIKSELGKGTVCNIFIKM